MLDLHTLRRANVLRAAEWPGPRPSLEFRGLEVGGEAGELQNKVKKLVRARNQTAGNRADETHASLLADIREEVGDVLISLDLLCMDLGVSIEEVAEAKFNATTAENGLSIYIHDNQVVLKEEPGNYE